MSNNSTIEWTDATWNPVTGCNKISPGCKNCYAATMAKRLQAMGQKNYKDGFKLTLQPQMLDKPLQWKKRKLIFVNSMSDLFHKDIPDDYIKKVFKVMNSADHHFYQVLTKRSDRLLELSSKLHWSPNIWMGVSVESASYQYRIDDLVKTGAFIKFLSIEPLLGPIPNMKLRGIDWVIVGGESGHGAREIEEDWVIDIRDQCVNNEVPFFFKQWGGVNKKKNGRLLEGRIWNQMPAELNFIPEDLP